MDQSLFDKSLQRINDYLKPLQREFLGYQVIENQHYEVLKPNPESGSPNAYTPIAFYSEDTHYSVMKAKTFYQEGMDKFPGECPILDEDGNNKEWSDMVPSEEPNEKYPIGSGAVDIDKLVTLVDFFTTKDITIERNCYWIHVDGALAAIFMPFVEMLQNRGKTDRVWPICHPLTLLIRKVNRLKRKRMGFPPKKSAGIP